MKPNNQNKPAKPTPSDVPKNLPFEPKFMNASNATCAIRLVYGGKVPKP